LQQEAMKSLTRIAKNRTRKGQKEKNKVRLPQMTSPLKIKLKPFPMSLPMSKNMRRTLKMKNKKRSRMRSQVVLTGSSGMPENNEYVLFLQILARVKLNV
jgi:hypothetical protein